MINFLLKQNKNQHVRKQGFTLVETLVSVTIFTVSALSLFAVLSQGISNTTYAKRKVTAGYLAQEGIEYIRNMRDTFVLYDSTSSQNGWNSFIAKLTNPCQTNPTGCYFGDISAASYSNLSQPITSIAVTACGSSCPALLYDSTSGKYGYFGTNSGFVRTIKMVIVNANDVKIYSIVSWPQGSGMQSLNFSEDLFNWVE